MVGSAKTRERLLLAAVAAGQALLMYGLLTLYRFGRHLIDGRPDEALRNANDVWGLERALWLPDEAWLQRTALQWDGWAHWANQYYVVVHFPATGLFLAWVFFRHREHWPRIRAAMALSLVFALVVHALYPLAPPRLQPGLGMVDLQQVYGPSAYPADTAEGMSNQFAAMPSLHCGWALLVAWAVIRYSRSRWRWLIVAHPVLTVAVVVLTANHYLLDGVAGGAVVALAVAAAAPLESRRELTRLLVRTRTAERVGAGR